ncbi:hypothetical protein [Salegentibacter salegens]|uniref:Uncharacterized protein n=1 Tax=Salegentibacter salegens TaxID=143223 RepID=A0A1M7NK15_9FLAO|nr:hypothetical protein [Salegentibacter salegens]PRX41208.1 hypothetical protein LY58_02995 [Salegentibacter salegens]SHN04194.1 hypothetical protein SAMN05878281_3229 [Salegentibacter salegens]
MKIDPQMVDESTPYSSLLNDDNLLLQTQKEELPIDFPKSCNKINFNNLTAFWKRLVSRPQSLPQTSNSSISSILENEKNISSTQIIKTVLSKKLELPLDSIKLSKALEECNKIFHEDYPFDFILEYEGKRLGMILLDRCYNSKNEEKLIYRFNSNLKSFEGLF